MNCKSHYVRSCDPCYLHSKDSYHSSRRDVTAQIDAATKYAKLQSDQVSYGMLSHGPMMTSLSLTKCHNMEETLGRTEDQLLQVINL